MEGHITERARKYAEKLVKKPPEDNRSTDEKMAEFMKKYDPMAAVSKARHAAKRK